MECLKWFVEEQGIPLTVPDAGGETLIHHAAFHGQVKCLEYLLHRANKSGESVCQCYCDNDSIFIILFTLAYTDESGVTPAHFAAQRGHLDCLRVKTMHPFIHISIHSSTYLSIHPYICPFIHISIHSSTYLSIYPCIYPFIHISIHSSTYLYIHPCIYPFIHISIHSSMYLSIHPHIYPLNPLSVHLPYLFIHLFQLFINRGFDVTLPDHENMKPSDWADAMGQHSCTQYLLMFELCWQLSRDVSRLTQQVETLVFVSIY